MSESVNRKKKGANFNVHVGTSVPEIVFRQIETLAQRYRMSNAGVLRELALRGLASYQRDGKVRELNEAAG